MRKFFSFCLWPDPTLGLMILSTLSADSCLHSSDWRRGTLSCSCALNSSNEPWWRRETPAPWSCYMWPQQRVQSAYRNWYSKWTTTEILPNEAWCNGSLDVCFCEDIQNGLADKGPWNEGMMEPWPTVFLVPLKTCLACSNCHENCWYNH